MIELEKINTKKERNIMKKNEKTNVMRILDQKKISYLSHYYADTEAISGVEVAAVLNQNPEYCNFQIHF